ncbi:MAG: hypothetical protein HZB99_02265 [Candidatus Harrisonbacteria bacterium]|nr:hypothetical protein [Candidatus Harrisonbacteria bacterium]
MLNNNPVRTTTLNVVETARQVKINREAIEKLAAEWNKTGLPITCWNSRMHLETDDETKMLDYLIILDSLNFCFWHPRKERWSIVYNHEKYSGYFALSLALKNYFERHPSKANLRNFADISFEDFIYLLQGGNHLLFLDKRWEIIKAVSQYLVKRGGSKAFILSADQKLSILIPKIAESLSSFDDTADYNGKKVYIWKRAQILAVDIYGALCGRGAGYFTDLDYPTAFADYKLPQILVHYGILEYSPELKKKIEDGDHIPPGSAEEVEIRSATVWAVEWLKNELKKYGGLYESFLLDWVLWEQSQKEKMQFPHHRTQTIFY